MEKVTSFAQEVKEELTFVNEQRMTNLRPLLSAFIRTNGTITFHNKQVYLRVESENARSMKFVYTVLKDKYNQHEIHFTFSKVMNLKKKYRYAVEVSDADSMLEDLQINFLESKIPYELTNKEEKIKSYLTGLFLACGSVNHPSSSNYHLEFCLKDEGFAKAILKLTNKIKVVEFNFKMVPRRNNYVVYIKKSDLISSFLAYIDANDSCIKFEDVRVTRDYNNSTNRLLNCDSYNFKKTLDNAYKQINYIKFLDSKIGIKNITNEKVKILCELRVDNPEMSYEELAVALGEKIGKQISKSNINHLFRKIKEMALEYNYED